MTDREALRLTYLSFKVGARLRSEDVGRLMPGLTKNQLRELGRNSDRGPSITAAQLFALMSAWASEQRPDVRA